MMYLNQTAAYRAGRTVDAHGDPVQAEPVQVACRREPCIQLLQKPDGTLYQTSNRFFLGVAIEPHAWADSIDGLTIARVSGMVNLSGDTVGYEVYT